MFNFTDNSRAVLKELERKLEIACEAIGEDAETFAKRECPVDTGRLRNSITYATRERMGIKSYEDNNHNMYNDGENKAIPEKRKVYIGTNVEYAPQVEFIDMHHNNGNAHFLKNSVTNHSERYKALAKGALM